MTGLDVGEPQLVAVERPPGAEQHRSGRGAAIRSAPEAARLGLL